MKLSKALSRIRNEAAKSPEFWVERAKLDFAVALEGQRRNAKLSYKQIAVAISSSAAYVSKVFRGDSNLTIETMVKLADAAGGRIEIKILDKASASASGWAFKTPIRLVHNRAGSHVAQNSTTYVGVAANGEKFGRAA